VLREGTFSLGYDPGLANIGLALRDSNGTLVKTLHVKTEMAGQSKKDDDWVYREHEALQQLIGFVEGYPIGIMVAEGPSFASFGATISILQIQCVTGFILGLMAGRGIEIAVSSPSTLKKIITGKGNMPKKGVLATLRKKYNDETKPHKYTEHELEAAEMAQIGMGLEFFEEANQFVYSNEHVTRIVLQRCRGIITLNW